MIKYSFDEVIDRRGTHAVKLDGMQEIWGKNRSDSAVGG